MPASPFSPIAPPSAYLASTEWIDHSHPLVALQARVLAVGAADAADAAGRCFEWVRDEVLHSGDHARDPVTCQASDVLRHKTGYCYAKAHLLAALLRANGLRAGLAYQRLSLDGKGEPFALHGLVAVELPGVGWFRADPRGNKPGLDARFTPPVERLAFAASLPGERDFPEIHAVPLPEVVEVLTGQASRRGVESHLPDRRI